MEISREEFERVYIKRRDDGVELVWREHVGGGRYLMTSKVCRRVSEMTKELKVAALLDGRWVDSNINVRFRRGGKTSQDL